MLAASALVTSILFLYGCDDGGSAGTGSNQRPNAAGKASDHSSIVRKNVFVSYGESGTRDNWPPLLQTEHGIAKDVQAKNYYLVIDGSGSMQEIKCSGGHSKMSVAKTAISGFVSKLPANANVGVFAFDRAGVQERLPLGRHSSEETLAAIQSIRAGGGTPLSTSIEAGVSALTTQAVKQLGYGEYHLVVVTDGLASSGFTPDHQVNQLLANTPIVLHTIGFCINDQHPLNRPGYTLYKAADNPQSLIDGLDAVLAEAPEFNVGSFKEEP